MAELYLQNVTSAFDQHKILDSVNLSLEKGEIGCLLGPSGCGKTTLLRTIVGLQPLQNGEIYLNQRLLSSQTTQVETELRQIGMVFQDYALFPHLTVKQNILFGVSHLQPKKQHQRLTELLALINLPDIANRYPHELSGGQQQRVALARALAPKPQLLLMDEPFSGLDKELRENLAKEIRHILKIENITALMVTHDQNEAFAIADSVGVMQEGKLLQWDQPYQLYHQPKHLFVADFIGRGVFINGKVTADNYVNTALGLLKTKLNFIAEKGDEVSVLVRPDDIVHDDNSDFKLEIINRDFRGSYYYMTLRLSETEQIMCLSQSHHDHPIGCKIGIKLEMDHAIGFKKLIK